MSNELTIKEFYEAACEAAIETDPRGKEKVIKFLAGTKKEYEKMTNEKKKKNFDLETLKNPYADSRILHGDINKKVSKVICGIDLEVAELMLTDRLNEKGSNIDFAIAHHPEGTAQANFYDVMYMQSDIIADWGVPINKSEGATKKRMADIEKRVSSSNHMRSVDAAKLLDIAYACMHTFADNHVATFLTNLMEEKKPEKVSEVVEIIESIEEFQMATKNNNPPKMFAGSDKNRAGKVIVDMTGGTTADVQVMSQLANAGVGTIIVMHLPEEHRKECEKNYINVVCAGHIGSDSLGLNLMFKAIRDITKKDFEVVPCSGLLYIKR